MPGIKTAFPQSGESMLTIGMAATDDKTLGVIFNFCDPSFFDINNDPNRLFVVKKRGIAISFYQSICLMVIVAH